MFASAERSYRSGSSIYGIPPTMIGLIGRNQSKTGFFGFKI